MIYLNALNSRLNRRSWLSGSLAVAAASVFPARRGHAAEAKASTGEKVMLSEAAVADLQKSIKGDVILPSSANYDAVRKVWNPAVDHYPALIARCTSVSDIQAAVQFARAHNLLTGVRCGGHGYDGAGMAHGGLTIDLAKFGGAKVDVAKKRAYVNGGAVLGDLDRASVPHNLGTTAGVVSHTGVGGLATGQGQGRLGRKMGYTVDNFRAVEVVLPDGRFVRADEKENADLFWAVRGGGGNFGIVTLFEFELYEFDPSQITSFSFTYPVAKARDAMRLAFDMGPSVPFEMTMGTGLRVGENNEVSASVSGTYIGSGSDAEKLLKPLAALGEPTRKRMDTVDYLKIQTSGDGKHVGDSQPVSDRAVYNRGGFFDKVDGKVVDTLVDYVTKNPNPGADPRFSQLGGAANKISPDAMAFCHREIQYGFTVDVSWRDPKDMPAKKKYAHDLWAEIYPASNGAFYINQAVERTDEEMVRTFGKAYPRLVQIKTKYDPTNFFHLNPNIKPRVA